MNNKPMYRVEITNKKTNEVTHTALSRGRKALDKMSEKWNKQYSRYHHRVVVTK